MTTTGTQRHPFETLLEQLTGLMSAPRYPIRHGFGTQEDAEHTNADRVIWIPSGLDAEAAQFSVSADDSQWRQSVGFEVSLYAGSFVQLCSMHASLIGNIDLTIGPAGGAPPSQDGSRPYRPGYRIGPSTPAPRGGDNKARGWGVVVPVTLFAPIFTRGNPLGLIHSVERQTIAQGPDGSGAEVATDTQ